MGVTRVVVAAWVTLLTSGGLAAGAQLDVPADPAGACAALSSIDLGPGKIVRTTFLSEGFKPSPAGELVQVPPFCRVALHSALSTDSSIHHEVWLPARGWNGRFLGTGNGGWAGRLVYRALAAGVRRGFAVANTDMGTSPVEGGAFAVGHPVRWLDYGQRATHDMTTAGKALVSAYYGRAARFSYFEGCSTGGFQGLRAAELFPDDYDGIIAGHPGDRRAAKVMSLLFNFMQPKLHPEGILSNDDLMMMHEAVLDECAGKGGGLPDDPFVTVPTACEWKPESLLCRDGNASDCLTQAQVDMANRLYRPWVLPSTGEHVFAGLPRGTELGWNKYMEAADEPDPPHAGIVRSILGAGHDFLASDWDRDVTTYLTVQGALWADGPPTDLARFREQGGKMLIPFGLNDTSTFYDAAEYYEGVQHEIARSASLSDTSAGTRIRESMRLFTLPGVEHCGGGNGPNEIDALTPLMTWVETGVAPERIDATWVKTNGFGASLGRPMSRPSCAYPQVAKYVGDGDVSRAESFRCGPPDVPSAKARVSRPKAEEAPKR